MGEFQIFKGNRGKSQRRRCVHVVEAENSDTPNKLPKADFPHTKQWEPLI